MKYTLWGWRDAKWHLIVTGIEKDEVGTWIESTINEGCMPLQIALEGKSPMKEVADEAAT